MERRRAFRKAERDQILRLTDLLSNHAARATKRAGKMRACACDLCGHAMKKLEQIRGKA